ncbi:MAG TPA: hypothetical protein DEA96_14165, partial [Leptospiraceae bacterium]|nr:hypothetical protein [Leptospiraceae bacterium]
MLAESLIRQELSRKIWPAMGGVMMLGQGFGHKAFGFFRFPFHGLLLSAIAIVVFSQFSLPAQPLEPDVVGEPDTASEEEPAPSDFRLAINPGVVLGHEDLVIKKGQESAVGSFAEMDGGSRPSWHVDLTTADWKLEDFVGIHLLAWAGNLEFKKQMISTLDEQGQPDRISSDLGTRMTGYYTVISPVLYVGSNNRYDGFRFGFGYGVQSMRISGNFIFQNEDQRVLLFSQSAPDRSDFVRNLQQTTLFSSGFNVTGGDPIASYLILNLQQPWGLETYGKYILFRDGFSIRGNNLVLLNYLTRGAPAGKLNLSLEEAYGAISLGRNNVNITRKAAGTGFMFLSWGTGILCPTDACIFQGSYGVTFFKERELHL